MRFYKMVLLMLFPGFQCVVFAIPPFMWFATHSINDYVGNGDCGRPNLDWCHYEADGFASALNALYTPYTEVNYRYNRRDSECTAQRWTGEGAETNHVDFLYYSGH